jgi:UDP-N-acetylglucosamine 3-dehydrogenase
MEKLRIGVIGLGWFGEIHCEALIGIANIELAALCTRNATRLGEMAAKFGVQKTYADYRDLLADPDIDAVSIVTMWDQHTDPTIAALEAGKHVFLEKPMASTVDDCLKIIAASRKAKGILQVGHIVRFNPRYRAAREAIEAGRIGKVVSLASRRNIPAAWTPTILEKIGPIVGDAIHDTDIMLWFTGDRIVSAYAQTVSVRGLKFPDIGQTMYRFASGATATLETVWCMPEKTPYDIDERMNVVGTEGFLQVQDTFPNMGIADSGKFHSPDTTYWPMFEGVRGGALREEFSYFAGCALAGRKPAIGTPEDAMMALQATLAAEESARTGEVVKIPALLDA